MRKQADVRSIEALREAKAALAEFRELASTALSEAKSDVQRVLSWVQHDRRSHWEREIKRRMEMVSQARADLERARFAAMDSTATCLEQRRNLERAERAVEEARWKLGNVKAWSHKLEREILLFRGRCQGLARAVEGELPRGEARLDVLYERLERYVKLAPPPSAVRPSAPPAAAAPPPSPPPASSSGPPASDGSTS